MQRRARILRLGLLLGAGLSLLAAAPPARAGLIVDRPLTLPGSGAELILGLGLGHRPAPGVGFGLNLSFAYGLTSQVELAVRTGLRLGRDGRLTQADTFGRVFETETWGVGFDEVANPELTLRFALARGTADLGLETALYLPIEQGTRVGVMLALPLQVRLGGAARLDTGVYVPIIFRPEDTNVTVSLPLHLWLRVSGRTCLGPLLGLRFHEGGGRTVPLGLGLGQALGAAELRTWVLFPDIGADAGARWWGAGLALAVRF